MNPQLLHALAVSGKIPGTVYRIEEIDGGWRLHTAAGTLDVLRDDAPPPQEAVAGDDAGTTRRTRRRRAG